MGNNSSNFEKTIRSAIDHDRGWLHRDLTDVHRRALGHVLKALGMKPLKPQDAVLTCGACGDETLVVRCETGICVCLACMEACNGAALPVLLKGKPPTPERRLVDSYQLTCGRVPLGNAKDMTRRLAVCCVLDEMWGDGMSSRRDSARYRRTMSTTDRARICRSQAANSNSVAP
jgi:ribosomal protein L37AE/L43A